MLQMIDGTSMQVWREPQIFVDNWLIEQADGITRRWHKPQRLQEEPVLKRDRPWEQALYFTYSNFNVLKDPTDGLIKCWYEDMGPMEPYQGHPWRNRMLYAVSSDGVNFDKPLLGRVNIDGADTNIFGGYVEGAQPSEVNPWADVGLHSAAIVIDPDPSNPDERYRMLFSKALPDVTHEIVCAHSSDGTTWVPYDQKPSFGSPATLSDVSTITYDPRTKLFLQYTRHQLQQLGGIVTSRQSLPMEGTGKGAFLTYFPHRPDLMNKRRVFRTVSTDFLDWADLVPISTPDDDIDNIDEAHYGAGQFKVGSMYFGTMGVLKGTDDEMYVRLIYSRDGVRFRPTDNGKPFLAPRGEGHWDRHMVSIVSPPVRFGDEWYFYHGGSHCHHDLWYSGDQKLDHEEARDPATHMKYAMGIAKLRFEGIASMDSVLPRLGRLITRPMLTNGKRLKINAKCRPGGWIKVAVYDDDGQIMAGRGFDDCIPFSGDEVRHAVRWQTGDDFGGARGPRDFRKLAFLMQDAEIFSFVFD